MFSKKVPKSQSSAELLKILTKRSSHKRLSLNKGVYNDWPTQQKPSLLNCSTDYLKYLSSQIKGDSGQKNKIFSLNRSKSSSIAKKIPATFSTCTTMEFFPSTQQNIYSKFTKTPQSQEQNKENYLSSKLKFTPYVTPQLDQSQIIQENESAFNKIHQQEQEAQLNSKYDKRPQTFNQQRQTQGQNRRLVNTAKINRQKFQIQEPNTEVINIQKNYFSRPTSAKPTRPITENACINQGPQLTFKPFTISKNSTLNIPNSSSFKNIHLNSKLLKQYPMRLKDYETNFPAFKVISQLIDHQMKWQPKKRRPKSSVSYRKYQIPSKV